MNEENKLYNYWDEFEEEFFGQLDSDFERWGETWRQRNIGNQVERVYNRYQDYYDQWKFGGNDFPWLKVIGNAYIAWVRTRHPEILLGEEHA